MKYIDVNLNVNHQQYEDLQKAERIDLHISVDDELGVLIRCYPEKDLALTWEDVKLICSLYEQIVPMTEWDVIENEKNYPTDESFYSEILNRFNEQRKK